MRDVSRDTEGRIRWVPNAISGISTVPIAVGARRWHYSIRRMRYPITIWVGFGTQVAMKPTYPVTNVTDRQTDRQTDGRHACRANRSSKSQKFHNTGSLWDSESFHYIDTYTVHRTTLSEVGDSAVSCFAKNSFLKIWFHPHQNFTVCIKSRIFDTTIVRICRELETAVDK